MKNSLSRLVMVFLHALLYMSLFMFSSGVNAQSAYQLEKECSQGNISSCQSLRSIYNSGQGVNKNKLQPLRLFQRACDGGDLDGCIDLGMLYEKGKGVRKDKYKAAEIYRKACDGGNGVGCYKSGEIYARGDGVTRNKSMSVFLFSIGCELGNTDSCLSLNAPSQIESNLSKKKITDR
jgi:uncharacterized protein